MASALFTKTCLETTRRDISIFCELANLEEKMLVIITVLLIVSIVCFYVAIREKENLGGLIFGVFVATAIVAIVALGANIYGIGTSEGLPVGERFFSNTNLPPEDINQVVKTVDWEDSESIVYLTLVPYNNINGTRMLYRISLDDCETPINFSIGMIVNNDGMIQQV